MTTPPTRDVTLDQWRLLYATTQRVHALAPWTFMDEAMLFAVREPSSGTLGFVSVMGALGSHLAVSVYRGAEGLYGFYAIQESAGDEPSAELFFEVPQVQMSLEDRGQLEREDKAVIDALGLKFRGRQAWPLFRSYVPGHFPWFIDAAEARLLQCALEQLLDVAPRFRPGGPPAAPSAKGPYLLRACAEDGSWQDGRITMPPPAPIGIPLSLSEELLEKARRLPRTANTIEIDFFLFPALIQAKKGQRPACSYVLLLVDRDSGIVIDFNLSMPEPDLHHMWGKLPATILGIFAKHGHLPLSLAVRSPLLAELLPSIALPLGVTVERCTRLPALEMARRSLERSLRR
jgi:Domain of unknown function (DUF6930)